MVTIQLPTDFKEFLKLLNAQGVEYLVIGGYAVGYYGYPRATGDLDIWISKHHDNINKIISVLKEFGFDDSELTENLFIKEDKILRLGNPPLRIEIMASISGVEFDECYDSKTVSDVDGIPVNLISLIHLKKNKKASNRHIDLNDLEHLP